ncbi:MAG: hypothetical protein ACI9UN_000798 [Granulosicoccus sp.]|jgi:hypothetical protein
MKRVSVAERFPDDVIVLLHNAQVTVSCVPIQVDDGQWQAAIFFVLAKSAPCLTDGQLRGGPFAVEFDADLHEHEKGTLIEVGIDIATPVENSLGTLLFITGHSPSHFESIKLLSEQPELPLFIGNEFCEVLYRQRIPVSDVMRSGFKQLLDEAVSRDAVIRMTGHYDPDLVFADTVTSLQLA